MDYSHENMVTISILAPCLSILLLKIFVLLSPNTPNEAVKIAACQYWTVFHHLHDLLHDLSIFTVFIYIRDQF